MHRYSSIIVANRLPIHVVKENGKLAFHPSSGGLATAMAALPGGSNATLWIGWPGIGADDLTSAEKTQVTEELHKRGCHPLFLTNQEVSLYYEGYANSVLWPLFHYFTSFVQLDNRFWEAYQQVNQRFADEVALVATAQATIWIHDYQLLLLPSLIRSQLPEASIGFFLHTPFPSFEVFRILPNRRAILEGLLGADLIGFHIYDYAHYFLSCVKRVLGLKTTSDTVALEERSVIVDAFPIGIEYSKFAGAVDLPKVQDGLRILDKEYKGRKLIASVDRLDYTKGLPQRLEAFELLLKQYPEYIEKVCLAVVAIPSRTNIGTYRELRESIEGAVGRINGTYGTAHWTPISYQFRNLPFEQFVALYIHADVALVTPLRDGMNLVAKEYVASKAGKNTGVLVLSELAGAADELQEALFVNPNDVAAQAAALHAALTLPKHVARSALQAMQRRISHYTVERWAADFTEQLAMAGKQRMQQASIVLSPKISQQIVQKFRHAERRLLLLDYDGTLRGFVNTPDPAAAAPSASLLDMLQKLGLQPNTTVAIISGRTRDALQQWFGDLPLTLVAEHGAWVKHGKEWQRGVVADVGFKTLLRPVLEHYAERTPGAVVEEKDLALVWHYRNVPPELAYARNLNLRRELKNALAGTDIGVFSGNKVIEIKPFSVHKGTVVETLMSGQSADFILCAGDDYTDEDMFKALPLSANSIKVGPGATKARFQAASVETLTGLLRSLAGTS